MGRTYVETVRNRILISFFGLYCPDKLKTGVIYLDQHFLFNIRYIV